MVDWFQDAFSICSHGLVKTYCASCAIAMDEAVLAEERQAANVRDRQRLERRVRHQSDALDDAYGYIGELKRRLEEGR